MSFHEALFPLSVAFGATGGPERRTEIVALASGHERRNARWAHSRRRYDAGSGVRTLDELHEVLAFFEERRGRLYGFRFRDFSDSSSSSPSAQPSPLDQMIGEGSGQQTVFSLSKLYGGQFGGYSRPIRKPVPESVRIAVDGVEVQDGWSVDGVTGEVAFVNAPVAGSQITAGYRFDVPVRFDSDQLTIDLAAFEAGQIPSIPLVEVRI